MVREKHGTKSKEFIISELNNELKENMFYEDILESIDKHSDINEENLSLFCLLVQFADKADFSKYRLEDNYREKFRYLCYEEINQLDLIYTDEEFGINIITNDVENFDEQFLNEGHPKKVIKVTKNLANKLNRKPVIMHNGKAEEYEKRRTTGRNMLGDNIIDIIPTNKENFQVG